MTDKNEEIRARKLQVKSGSQAEKELDHKMFLSKNLSNTCIYIQRNKFFTKKRLSRSKIEK